MTTLLNARFNVPAPTAQPSYKAVLAAFICFPHLTMNNHLSKLSPDHYQTRFNIAIDDIYNFSSPPPCNQESQLEESESSDTGSLWYVVSLHSKSLISLCLPCSREQESDASILDAFRFLKKYAPHLLWNKEELETLKMENVNVKKKIKKLKDDNDHLRKAKIEPAQPEIERG